MGIFGPNKKDILMQFCNEVGGEYVKSGFFKDNIARVKVKRWVIYLKFVTQTYGGESSVTINSTRMYVHYSNKDFFYFKLQRKGLLNILGKLIGIKYIEVGYPDFDRDFIIKGNDESKVRSLFGNPIIRSLIEVQPYIFFKLKGNVLYFQENSIIYDIKRLKSLYQLFVETLNQLYSERSRKPRQKRKVKHRN